MPLDYVLSCSWDAHTSAVALETADKTVLRYDCFLGDVIFLVGAVDLSARWGWVPTLDFALGLNSIVEVLNSDLDEEVFEFTESDDTITFWREGDSVVIEASYVPGSAWVSYEVLRVSAKGFLSRIIDDLARDHPELLHNGFIVAVLNA